MEIQDRLVSIIVPVYNAGFYIEETIAMVRSQTYENWELILVDDCSKDDGRRKIEGLLSEDKRIRLIAKPVNEGAARARNTGINAAAGRYIAFLDADDVWLPDKLERELSFMEEMPQGREKQSMPRQSLYMRKRFHGRLSLPPQCFSTQRKPAVRLFRCLKLKARIRRPGGSCFAADLRHTGLTRFW